MTETSPLPVLETIQARVLGCLIEKEATTPEAYPLTVNAAQLASNQKTAREPLLNLQTGAVHHALRQLETMGLVCQQFSSRAERYEHRLGSVLDVTRQQVALIGLLLLRGPQTLGELYARSERLARFADTDEVRHHLDRLIQRGLVAPLPRASGQREGRYSHLLSGELDVESLQVAVARASPTARSGSVNSELEGRVQRLEATVSELQDALTAVQARLDAADTRSDGCTSPADEVATLQCVAAPGSVALGDAATA